MTKPQSDLSPMRRLKVSFAPVQDRAHLAARWHALEARSERSFFLSWAWISAWIEGLESPPFLATVSAEDGTDIALGLFCYRTETRHRLIKARQLVLHATGDPRHDAITIEYNDLLCARSFESAAWTALITHLNAMTAPKWEEILVPGAAAPQEQITRATMPATYRRAQAGSAFVDLAALRSAGIKDRDGFIATLGKNTRSQIRRSLKLYREHGPVIIERAQTLDQAHTFFDAMARLHDAKWRARALPSAMSNTDYRAFHQRLIECSFAAGQVELLCARAGDHVFGWIYNFCDRGNVLFYCSGFRDEADNRLKPGLTTHVLAIEDHLKSGSNHYDFMAGDERYKRSLGDTGPLIVSYILQKSRPALILEARARWLKRRLVKKA